MEEVEQKEFEEIEKRRTGAGSYFKNLTGWRFLAVASLGFTFLYLLSEKNPNKIYYAMVLLGMAVIIFYSKEQTRETFISVEAAKRIARETIERRKEELEIEQDATITTGFSRLEPFMGQPYEWHVGIQVLTPEKEKKDWRVDIHPINGMVTGIANEKYDGNTLEKVYIQPDYYFKEA